MLTYYIFISKIILIYLQTKSFFTRENESIEHVILPYSFSSEEYDFILKGIIKKKKSKPIYDHI